MIYVAALLPVLVGIAMLTVDGARLFNLQTLLQNGVDAWALAGAKELDGKATSIGRSDLAIANLVSNSSKFGSGGVNIAVTQRYLSELPPLDNQDVETGCGGGSCLTVDPALAKYVEVKVTPASGSLNTIFPAAFFGVSNVVTTAATAIAGFNAVVCEFTPIFICNPMEDPVNGYTPGDPDILDAIGDTFEAKEIKRRLIDMRQQGGGGHYSPGNYGFLEPIDMNPGADALRDMIGMSNPPACFAQNGVTTRPGFVATIRDAVNTRFDMYEGPMNSKRNDHQFRPARNVRKGLEPPASGNPCNIQDPSEPGDPDVPTLPSSAALPKDNCFPDSCTHMGGRMGNGLWDFDTYWQANFGTGTENDNLISPPPFYSDGNPPSRYDVYRYELDNDLHMQGSTGPTPEKGKPTCYDDPDAVLADVTDQPDRRTIFGAVLNCVDIGLDGGRAGPYQVHAFAKFFITEPVTSSGGDQDIYAEIVDVFEPGADGENIVRDDVQLYR